MSKKPKLTRAGTMEATAMEGQQMLENQGFEEVEERETRSTKRAKESADVLLGAKRRRPEEVTASEMQTYVKGLKMAFRVFDENKDGVIDATELLSVCRSLGKKATAAKAKKILQEADTNKDGCISVDEFVAYMVQKRKLKVKGKDCPQPKKRKVTPTKAKVPAKKTPVKKATKKPASPPQQQEKTPKKKKTKPALNKELSITNFFTEFADQHDEIQATHKDAHLNPTGRQYDLGRERAFGMFTVLLYSYYKYPDVATYQNGDPNIWTNPKKALEAKGFIVIQAETEEEMLDDLHNHDQVWIIPGQSPTKHMARLKKEIKKFHDDGKGVFIWSDNTPYIRQANALLDALELGYQVTGNLPGSKTLTLGGRGTPKKGTFKRHLLTTGLVSLYEGITICHPTKITPDMNIIGTGTDGKACFWSHHPEKKGRIVVDCGFTKLYCNWDSAGTARFVRNCAVWLCGVDWRLKNGYPMKGPIDFSNTE